MKNTLSFAIFLVTIAIFYSYNGVAATCDPFSGPRGGRHCVKLQGYNDYQWMTCRSNIYIKLISRNKHQCAFSFVTYCYYQCMLEKYGKESGAVTGSCRCSSGPNSTPPPQSTNPRIASTKSPDDPQEISTRNPPPVSTNPRIASTKSQDEPQEISSRPRLPPRSNPRNDARPSTAVSALQMAMNGLALCIVPLMTRF